MKSRKKILAVILFAIAAFLLIAIFGAGDSVKGVRNMRFGIDIRGGVEAVFEPDGLERKATKAELDTAREVIEARLDFQNITDREVTVDENAGYIIVRFPWKSDETGFNPEDAIKELGDMAELAFKDRDGNTLIRGKHVIQSSVETQSNGVQDEYVVALKFDTEGARLFKEATGKMIGEQMPIYMDDEEISAPVVEAEISGGQAVINGMKNYEEAKTLSDKINAGALPFSLSTTSFHTISPTLGQHALEVMIGAGLAAFLIVCLFMIFYYKLPGVIACLTLVLQMTLQLLALSVPQFTLTLPGIAGIILSLGMAVDANIIIAERISEELRDGRTIHTAVMHGYKNGFSAVFDGNLTTAIVAVILMILGSGSMLSFGYTLLIGMIVNVAIGVTISKQLQLSLLTFPKWTEERYFRKKKATKTKHFFEKKYICGIISGILLLIGIAGCIRNGIQLDTQFTGGTVLTYEVIQTPDLNTIENSVETITERAVTVQQLGSKTSGTKSLEITLSGNAGITPEQQKEITKAVQDATSEKVSLEKTYSVQPYIGKKAMKNSGIAILLSFLFIALYVCIRFAVISGLPAALTALLALLHDVIIVFFAFVLFKIPLNDAFVAVILTIVGYSINDTIVVYDRIRENITKKSDVRTLVNQSISEVLARSVNTSLTTGVCVLAILVTSLLFHIDSIFEFSLPMFFGLISGCYSSVCIASTLWALWESHKSSTSPNNSKPKVREVSYEKN